MEIEWTTESPIRLGFYWVKCGASGKVEITEVYTFGEMLYWKCLGDDWAYGAGEDWRRSDMYRSIEPLEVPE